MIRLHSRLACRLADRERGSAIVEFVFVALLVMVPLIYLLVCIATVQRSHLGVTNAARDVGRAWATSSSADEASTRAASALQIALRAEDIEPGDVAVTYVASESSCTSAGIVPQLVPGATFAVCVTQHRSLPAIPNIVAGRGVTLVGRYVVHVDEYASVVTS